ncbi:hypothetical protein KP509_35G027300 [Ceratopteris richardii]|uniref:Uncharacterized protein n=1 Tax=Ceratopteris richardii TaxID=49495 RepID=A0A8T2QGS9_CERRI|nr:hypothetical protein KP509_35G027300 [Ceratopteris richardii]
MLSVNLEPYTSTLRLLKHCRKLNRNEENFQHIILQDMNMTSNWSLMYIEYVVGTFSNWICNAANVKNGLSLSVSFSLSIRTLNKLQCDGCYFYSVGVRETYDFSSTPLKPHVFFLLLYHL